LLGLRHGIPEFLHVASFESAEREISRAVGANRALGFVHHAPGSHAAAEIFEITSGPARSQASLFRQDIDAYLFYTAIRYGARARQQTSIREVSFQPGKAVVRTTRGEEFSARYVVDSSGRGSVLMAQLGIGVTQDAWGPLNRGLHTHMVAVRPFAAATRGDWNEGPLHHVFDGGYLIVTPFDNYRDAPNHVAGVEIVLDAEKFPCQTDPETEFRSLLPLVPGADRQFDASVAVQPWHVTGVDRYVRAQSVGERWCAVGATAGYTAELLSGSLIGDLHTAEALARPLLSALRDDDFPAEGFKEIEAVHADLNSAGSAVTSMLGTATRDRMLTRAVLHVWQLGMFYRSVRLRNLCTELADGRGVVPLDPRALDGEPLITEDVTYRDLLAACKAVCAEVDAEGTEPGQAAQFLFQSVADSGLAPPGSGLGEAEALRVGLPGDNGRSVSRWADYAPAGIRPMLRTALPDIGRGRI
jgi:FADH2 O2-dependent halogenase